MKQINRKLLAPLVLALGIGTPEQRPHPLDCIRFFMPRKDVVPDGLI